MILLWGLPGDDPFDAVSRELARRGAAVAILDQRRALDQRIELEISAGLGGAVWLGEQRLALDEVTALYSRVYSARQIKHVAAAGRRAPGECRAPAGKWWHRSPCRSRR